MVNRHRRPLDAIIGGGNAGRTVVEIFGQKAQGKTTLLFIICVGYIICAFGYSELKGTFDAERAKVFGNRPKQMLIYRAKYGEDAFNKTIKFAKAGIPLIGIDSVPSMMPKDDAEKVLKSGRKRISIEGT